LPGPSLTSKQEVEEKRDFKFDISATDRMIRLSDYFLNKFGPKDDDIMNDVLVKIQI